MDILKGILAIHGLLGKGTQQNSSYRFLTGEQLFADPEEIFAVLPETFDKSLL